MTEQFYLIAIALVEQEGQRIMPIGGKAIKQKATLEKSFASIADPVTLELLMRVFERSKDGSIRKSELNRSLYLLKIEFIKMQELLPKLKSKWIKSGNANELLKGLHSNCDAIWSVEFKKYDGIIYEEVLNENHKL